MIKLPAHERYTYDGEVEQHSPIEVAVEKQSRYQRRIAEMMAQEQREVDARLAAIERSKPPKLAASLPQAEPLFTPEHKLVFFPMTHDKKGFLLTNNAGERFIRLIPIGFRVMLDTSGGWWFYSIRFRSWTKHMPPTVERYKSLTPVTNTTGQVQMVAGGTVRFKNMLDLVKRLRHAPNAVIALLREQAAAEDELLEKLDGENYITIYPDRNKDKE